MFDGKLDRHFEGLLGEFVQFCISKGVTPATRQKLAIYSRDFLNEKEEKVCCRGVPRIKYKSAVRVLFCIVFLHWVRRHIPLHWTTVTLSPHTSALVGRQFSPQLRHHRSPLHPPERAPWGGGGEENIAYF